MAALFEIIWVKCCMKIWGHYNHRKNKTSGHVWQGRYKSFMAKKDSYYIGVMRYIEANALRAGLVEKVEDWIYGLLYARALPNAHLGGPLVELGDG
jgi:putative transposase